MDDDENLDDYLLQAHASHVAVACLGIIQRDEFYAAHLAVSSSPDFGNVHDAIEEDDGGLKVIKAFKQKVREMTDAEAKTTLLHLIDQQEWFAQISSSALRTHFDRATTSKAAT